MSRSKFWSARTFLVVVVLAGSASIRSGSAVAQDTPGELRVEVAGIEVQLEDLKQRVAELKTLDRGARELLAEAYRGDKRMRADLLLRLVVTVRIGIRDLDALKNTCRDIQSKLSDARDTLESAGESGDPALARLARAHVAQIERLSKSLGNKVSRQIEATLGHELSLERFTGDVRPPNPSQLADCVGSVVKWMEELLALRESGFFGRSGSANDADDRFNAEFRERIDELRQLRARISEATPEVLADREFLSIANALAEGRAFAETVRAIRLRSARVQRELGNLGEADRLAETARQVSTATRRLDRLYQRLKAWKEQNDSQGGEGSGNDDDGGSDGDDSVEDDDEREGEGDDD